MASLSLLMQQEAGTKDTVRQKVGTSMANAAKVSRVAVGLVVAGGVIWVGSAILYSAQIVSCFTCGPSWSRLG
jgi:hypothetical protein